MGTNVPLRWFRGLPCAALLGAALAAWAGQAFAESYLILPLIGDRITIVGQQQQTGSRIDQNKTTFVQIKEPGFDNAALIAVDKAIHAARPNATTSMLRSRDPKVYALRDSWLSTDAVDVRELLTLVTSLADSPADAHLVLITPYRSEPMLKTDRDYRGTGMVAGLGFYLDASTPLKNDAGESGIGFLGLFANFQIAVIDLSTKTVEARERVVVGATFPTADGKDRKPWNALSDARKESELINLMSREIESTLPRMLAARKL
ncbi:MAG: hypothetical protein ABI569_07070 [Casimicrobiaceae bacterium]